MISKRWILGLVCGGLMLPACTAQPLKGQTPPAQPEPAAAPKAAVESQAHAEKLREKYAVAAARAGQAAGKGNGVYFYGRSGGKKEKAAYLGVTTAAADPALRDQLKMPRGIGLVIQSVEPNSPAGKAGLQEHDLITKFDDQWLINTQQLGVLVRMHKPNDEITLTGLRHGDPITIKAQLIEKEMVVSEVGESMSDSMLSWSGDVQLDGQAMKELPALFQIDNDDDTPLIISENDVTLKVTVEDGKRHLTATDKDGNETFNGPVETEEQRKALPADLAQLLEKYKEQFDKAKEGTGTHKTRIITNDR